MGVIIFKRGDKFSLRAMLPAKPSSGNVAASQQTIALDIYANPAGIKRAEAEARKVGGLLACKEFSWDPYVGVTTRAAQTVAEWATKFKEDYFTRRSCTPKSQTTWRTEYQTVFNALPPDEELSNGLLLKTITATEPDSRSRQRFCMVTGQLAKFAGLDFNSSPFAGSYSPRRVSPRELPTDKEIAQWRARIPVDHGWQYAFGLMATYGLRNHELFNLDLDSLTKPHGILTVLDGKTGARRVWPCFPEWYDKWHLWEIDQLPQVTGKDNSALGGRVTQALKRYGFCKPYEPSTGDKYRSVHTTPQSAFCDCEDFEHQHAYLSQHPYLWQKVIKGYSICKHSLCALSQLGFSSLSSYLKAWQPGGRLNQLAVTMNRMTRRSA